VVSPYRATKRYYPKASQSTYRPIFPIHRGVSLCYRQRREQTVSHVNGCYITPPPSNRKIFTQWEKEKGRVCQVERRMRKRMGKRRGGTNAVATVQLGLVPNETLPPPVLRPPGVIPTCVPYRSSARTRPGYSIIHPVPIRPAKKTVQYFHQITKAVRRS